MGCVNQVLLPTFSLYTVPWLTVSTKLMYTSSLGVALGIMLVMITTSPGTIVVKMLISFASLILILSEGTRYPFTHTQTLSTSN